MSLEERKSALLKSLSGNKLKYKRFTGSPLRYAGGKSLAVGFVVEQIPDNTKEIVSPFIGGGSVEIACAKHLDIPVLGCDVFDVLVAYWQMQIEAPEELYKILVKWEPTDKKYRELKEVLRKHWKDEEKLPKLELAAHYFFNHNLSYGPGFLGWMSKIYADKNKYIKAIEKVKNFKADKLRVECTDFGDCIESNQTALLYCDPPYYLEGDSKMFRGIYPMRNFPVHHDGFDHEKLRDLLHSHKGKFILSYNDCSAVREWYKDFEINEVVWQYTMGQGETRIGANRINENRDHVKKSHELLIIKR